MIYLIHFDRPLAHASHYIGYCADGRLGDRIARHRSGDGAKILAECNRRGIGYRVVRTWEGASRDDERRMKQRKKSRQLCPVCRGECDDASDN